MVLVVLLSVLTAALLVFSTLQKDSSFPELVMGITLYDQHKLATFEGCSAVYEHIASDDTARDVVRLVSANK